MSLDFDDIPTLETAGRLGRRPSPDVDVAEAYRRPAPAAGGLLGSLGLGLALDLAGELREGRLPGAALLGRVFSPRGGGAAVSYTTWGDCHGYQYDGPCHEACFGFEYHHMDPFYCATCAEQAADPANNPPYFWHFVGTRGSIQYKDNAGDPCQGRDAWKWNVPNCGRCEDEAWFRCHDGYKKYSGNPAWDPTICQGLVICDGHAETC